MQWSWIRMAADNGYEIQDEDDVFGLLNDLGGDTDTQDEE